MLRKIVINSVVKCERFQFSAVRTLSTKVEEPYTERQNKTGRPVSPHVTIYKWPMAAVSSVLNRATGMTLTVGVTGIGALALVGVDIPLLMSTIGGMPLIGQVGKFAVAFPLVYHYLGGLRHVIWDKFPETTLNNDDVEKSSWGIIGGAAVLGAVAALL